MWTKFKCFAENCPTVNSLSLWLNMVEPVVLNPTIDLPLQPTLESEVAGLIGCKRTLQTPLR